LLNRGLHYGDGLFETIAIKIKPHCILSSNPLWKHHYHRLSHGCELLGLTCPSSEMLIEEIQSLLSYYKIEPPCIVKLILTREGAGRGYQPQSTNSMRVLLAYDWPNYPDSHSRQGVAVAFSDIKLSFSLNFGNLKHLNRLDQVIAARGLKPPFAETLLSDIHENIIEGTRTNLFAFDGNHWITPALKGCGVKGVMREFIMAYLQMYGEKVVETTISKEQLCNMTEVFICNSVIGIWPVNQLVDTKMVVGERTCKLADEIAGCLWHA
jgi:4-amino-4-deoxychorismate lyase